MQREDKINFSARSTYIVSNYDDVVECFLQYLSARDLINASKVNSAWRKAASQVRRSRTRLECELYQEEEIVEINNPFAATSTLDQLPSFCLCIASLRLQERLGGYLNSRKMLQKSLPHTCAGNLLVTDASYQQQVEVAKLTFPDKVRGFEFRAHDEVDIQVDDLTFLLLLGDASAKAKQAIDKFVLGLRRIHKLIRAVGVLVSDGDRDPGFIKGVACYGNDVEVNHVFLPTTTCSREEIAAIIRQLPNKNFAQSAVILFSENQRFYRNIDEEEIRAHLPDTPLVRLLVSDVLILASELEDSVQMQSSVSGWRWELPPPLFVCDKRASGPGLALLLSRQHRATRRSDPSALVARKSQENPLVAA